MSQSCSRVLVAEERAIPTGPRGEKRPRDSIGYAVKVARIATGEVEDKRAEAPAQQRAGGRARAERLTSEERSELEWVS